MLEAVAANIWHLQHHFATYGLRISSRMTVIRFKDAFLCLHSPVPLSTGVRAQLAALGAVRYIVAHNAIIDENAHPAVEKASAVFTRA